MELSEVKELDSLLKNRIVAKNNKNWELSDQIRALVSKVYNVDIIDTKDGQEPDDGYKWYAKHLYNRILHLEYAIEKRNSWLEQRHVLRENYVKRLEQEIKLLKRGT